MFVVRLPGERTELLGIDRAGEAAASSLAADLGIAPQIRAELPGVGTLVTEFVGGTPATTEALLAPGVLERCDGVHPAAPRIGTDRRHVPDLPRRRVARPRRRGERRRSAGRVRRAPPGGPGDRSGIRSALVGVDAVPQRPAPGERVAGRRSAVDHRLRVRRHEPRRVRPRQPVGQLRLRRRGGPSTRWPRTTAMSRRNGWLSWR